MRPKLKTAWGNRKQEVSGANRYGTEEVVGTQELACMLRGLVT